MVTSTDGAGLRWTAMGSPCQVQVVGPDATRASQRVREMVADLEASWSRFQPTSDVARVNDAGGEPVSVAPSTLDVVADAIAWWRSTGGLFDPTVLPALEAAGYDRDHRVGHGPIRSGAPAPGCDGIRVDGRAGSVQLPPGVGIDLGGIGKGTAVDLAVESLHEQPGGVVELGGDLRVWGRPPDDEGWAVAVEDLRDGSRAALLWLRSGAVATSSTLRRRWRDGERLAHHVIDPRTGASVDGELVSVTVVAGRTAAAEVLAKAALVTGTVASARRMLTRHGVAGLLVPTHGEAIPVGELDRLRWPHPGEVA